MSQKLLVTGAHGFIGRHLVTSLGADFEVLSPSSRMLDLLDEVRVEAYLASSRPDVVIHTATWNATRVSMKDTSLVLDHNLRMFANLLRAKDHFGRLIHFGSGAEFAREHWQAAMSEDDLGKHIPTDAYGFSKYWIAIQTAHQPCVLNLRLFGVFGPHEDWRIRFPSNVACRLLHHLPATLRQDRRFDYLHVDDVVAALRHVLARPHLRGNLNLCRGETVLLSQVAGMIAKAAGRPLELLIEAPGETLPYGGSRERFQQSVPEWEPEPLPSALARLVAWYRDHLDEVPRSHLF